MAHSHAPQNCPNSEAQGLKLENQGESTTKEHPYKPPAKESFQAFFAWPFSKKASDLLHLLLEKRLNCLVLILQVTMKLLRLGRNLALQGGDLLGMLRTVLLKLGFKPLLLAKQLLDLALKRMHSIREVILLYGLLDLGENRRLYALLNLLEPFSGAGHYIGTRLVLLPWIRERPWICLNFGSRLLFTQSQGSS